jgi:thiol:disulfide interchange protein
VRPLRRCLYYVMLSWPIWLAWGLTAPAPRWMTWPLVLLGVVALVGWVKYVESTERSEAMRRGRTDILMRLLGLDTRDFQRRF